MSALVIRKEQMITCGISNDDDITGDSKELL